MSVADEETQRLLGNSQRKTERPLKVCCALGNCLFVSQGNLHEQFCGITCRAKRAGGKPAACRVYSCVLFLNALASLLHLTCFIVLLSVLVSFDGAVGITKPLFQSITVWEKFVPVGNETCAQRDDCFVTANDGEFLIFSRGVENGELTLEYLVLSFSALSFVFQSLRPWVGIRKKDDAGRPVNLSYLDEVRARVNWLRWVEYGFSALTMILAISFVVDPNIEFSTVLMVATSTAATQYCGLVGEMMLEADDQGRVREDLVLSAWVIHLTGWLLQFGVFTSIFNAYFQSAKYAGSNDPAVEPPSFVYLIVAGEAILFSSFGITQLLDFIDRTTSATLCCKNDPGTAFELVFVALSLTAKFFLSIVVAANLWVSPDA